MNNGMDAQWMAAAMNEAAQEAARTGIFQTRHRGIMPAKIRVSIWALKEDGSYCNTEYDTMIDPALYEEVYQGYLRKFAEQKPEITKDEVMDELHNIIDSFNTPKEDDAEGPSEETGPDQS